jgi:tetratricopeptide (TPR) repeat protein
MHVQPTAARPAAAPARALALPLPVPVAEGLLNALLQAAREGTLAQLLAQRPRLARRGTQSMLRPVLGTFGDAVHRDAQVVEAVRLLLHWAALQIRPEAPFDAAAWSREAWISRTSYRPMLAILCHFGFLPVPDFRDRYRRREDESAVDNLCGIWAVGPSTFYRYLDKGRRLILETLMQPATAERRLSLRRFAHRFVEQRRGEAPDGAQWPEWHARQADRCRSADDPDSALWHTIRAGRTVDAIALVRRFRTELAATPEVDALLAELDDPSMPADRRVDLRLAQAELWGTRNAPDHQLGCWEQALKIAQHANDRLMLGLVYGALGRHYEARDTDRAAAFFRDSNECLEQVRAASGTGDARVRAAYASSLQGLAWAYVLRNDPRSRTVLDAAEALRAEGDVPEEAHALLDQIWGEYWRRAGDVARAIEHKHRALNIFLRLGDQRQILSTYNNLSLLYAEAHDHDRAIGYAEQVIELARTTPVEPYLLANTWLNLGVAQFLRSDLDRAIGSYQEALRISLESSIAVAGNRARYNLAEAFYSRYRTTQDPSDEAAGDRFVTELSTAGRSEGDAFLAEAVETIKTDILGPAHGLVHERLVSGEQAAHPDELREIERHRAALALPAAPADRVRAHLAIANAYLVISTRERETALALIRDHDLGGRFDADIDALHMTFSRALTREKTLLATWRRSASRMLSEERTAAVLQHLLDAGSINKSGYADACGCGLATASKHLSQLVELGLLSQQGKGPSTRYVLVDA